MNRLPREVSVATLTLAGFEAESLEELLSLVLNRMGETLSSQPDIICLPETFAYHSADSPGELADVVERYAPRVMEAVASFARRNRCYCICPLYLNEGTMIYNAAALFDRDGSLVGKYDKVHCTVDEMELGVTPGLTPPPVFTTDFGVIGIQTCFDVNWLDGWESLREGGAEIVFWPSAFPGGRMLNSLAWVTQAYMVTSPWCSPARIIDLTGQELASSGRHAPWVSSTINLEKRLIHIWPYMDRIKVLRDKYGQKLRVSFFHDEDCAVIESLSPGLALDMVLTEFQIPTHRDHIRRAQQAQMRKRRS